MKIRTRIITAFLLIIMALTAVSVAAFVYQYYLARQYQQISKVMVSEYQIVGITENMIEAYYNSAKVAQLDESFGEYYEIEGQLDDLVAMLAENITRPQSAVKLQGVLNIIEGIKNETHAGINDAKAKNIEFLSAHHQKARGKLTYLNEASTNLILSDLEHLNDTSKRLDNLLAVSLVVGAVVIGISFLLGVIVAVRFAQKITEPIEKLSGYTELVTGENMDLEIDKKLIEGSDEISGLAKTFQLMVTRLKENINKMTVANEELTNKTAELEELNKAMVGREQKMIELKKEIEQLRAG